MTKIHEKTKLHFIKTPHGVISKQFRHPALRGNEVNMDFNSLMEKAYEDYFNSLAEGKGALSFA
ncbi:hypothetical protein GFI13_13030, partial [Salmonella enterica subsp. enterica]|nr:hypothetical protein [Salmonella enterica subsp. enterica serovar Bovismorbificans]